MQKLLQRVASTLAFATMATTAVQAQRSTKLPGRPVAGPAKPFVYPAVTVDTLPNGLRFAVVAQHELPLVVVRTAFAGAGPQGMSFLDPAGKEGAWGLLLSSLRDGTPTRPATAIVDELADLGTMLTFTTPPAFTPPWFRAAKSTWVPSLNLLADLFINAAVSPEAISRAQTTAVTAFDRTQPISIANRVLYSTLYGQESAYNHFPTSASVKAINRDDLLAMKRDFLGPQNALIVITGDVTVAEARRAVLAAFGKWERSAVTVAPTVPAAPSSPAPTAIYLKDSPGLATPTIATGQILPGRNVPDEVALEAVVAVLGDPGAAGASRVYRAFRTDRGLAYAPGVALRQRPIPESVTMAAVLAVPADSVDAAVKLWLQVVREIRSDKPVLTTELEFARNGLIGRLPRDVETLEEISARVLSSLNDRLPPSYLNQWIRQVGSLTVAQVQAAASRYLDPEHMPIVVVGDRSKIEATLRATGIPVVIVP